MAAKDIKEFVELRNDIDLRITQIKAILQRDEVEVRVPATEMFEGYYVRLPKADFESTLAAQRDKLTNDLADMDAKLEKWTGELTISK